MCAEYLMLELNRRYDATIFLFIVMLELTNGILIVHFINFITIRLSYKFVFICFTNLNAPYFNYFFISCVYHT